MNKLFPSPALKPDTVALIVRTLAEFSGSAGAGPARQEAGQQLDKAGAPDCVVHKKSLTVSGETAFVALDILDMPMLVQTGGEESDGLGPPMHTAAIDGVTYRLYNFGSTDREAVRYFAEKVDRSFLPRPQGAQAAIAAGNRHPEISLPAVFDAFQQILEETGKNAASTVQLSATREMTTDDEIAQRDGTVPTAPGHTRVSIRHLYHAGLWAAIRSGYRAGYNAEADHLIVSGNSAGEIAKSVEWVKEALRHAAGYTKFTTDTSRLFDLRADLRAPNPWSETEIDELFEKRLTPGERSWVLSEFSKTFECGSRSYKLSVPAIKRLAAKFGPSLKLNEDLYDTITRFKSGAPFDFEPSLDEADTLTTPEELIFYMHWLRERGRPAQLVPPNLGFKKRQAYPGTRGALAKYVHHKIWPELLPRVDGEFGGNPIPELKQRVRDLADVARLYDGTLSVHSGSGKQAEVLQSIGEATQGRLNYKISGELQLQLFDAMSEQPEGSQARGVFDRMVAACERFAAANAFGEESLLAADYRNGGFGSYLGDAAGGRTDGNLFLVFWLGNMVGCRDEGGEYFKDEIDALPKSVIEETRARNTAYIKWLAKNLLG